MRIPRRTIERLRDRLLSDVARPSGEFRQPEHGFPSENPFAVDANLLEEFEAIFEAMYLMMAADGHLAEAELDVLRDTMLALSGGRIRAIHIEQMLGEFDDRSRSPGDGERLVAICQVLRGEPIAAESAYALCAAVARADDQVVAAEVALLERLAAGLDIPADRAFELRAELEGTEG